MSAKVVRLAFGRIGSSQLFASTDVVSRRSDRQRGWNRSTVRQPGTEIVREGVDRFVDPDTSDDLRETASGEHGPIGTPADPSAYGCFLLQPYVGATGRLTHCPARPPEDPHPQAGRWDAPAGVIASAHAWPGMNSRARQAARGPPGRDSAGTVCCDPAITAALSSAVSGGCRTPGRGDQDHVGQSRPAEGSRMPETASSVAGPC
ncbi:hypothetical protein [Streptomyces sp. NPDC101455]|uniref:hypothetical protein n=1 Tax=Streptomyces sp. NPDC101455 TaxID=3366142 RepID=UPI003815B217